jgi:hypothetical protein
MTVAMIRTKEWENKRYVDTFGWHAVRKLKHTVNKVSSLRDFAVWGLVLSVS